MELKAHLRSTKTWKVMKLTSIFLLAACLQVSARGFGQITIQARNTSLDKILPQIEQQSGYTFFYKEDLLANAKKVDIDVKNASLEKVLQELFSGQPLTYSIVEKTIILKPAILKDKEGIPPPPGDIKGRIINEAGEPMAGVFVQVKGSQTGAITSANGEFILTNVDPTAILVISATNIEGAEIKVNGKTEIRYVATMKVSKLDEVQIIAYGTTTRRLNTGSVATVKSEDIAKQPVANPLSALQGRMPGVLVTNGLGLPGSNVKIQVRGVNSIAGGVDPLYIVDGVPFTATPLNLWRGELGAANGYLSPFNSINPADIESIDVLKDADATALYGSRGANGVVLITTKKGKAGRTKLDINIARGTEKVTRLVKSLKTRDYVTIRREAFANDGVTPDKQNAPELMLFDTTKYTDYQKLMIGNNAPLTDVQTTITGGNEATHFLLGGNYRNEGTVFPGHQTYIRAGVHLNMEHNSADNRFYTAASVSYTADKNNTLTNIFNFNILPNYPLYDTLGNYNWIGGGNPLAYSRRAARSKTNSLTFNTQLRYRLLPGLHIQTNLGYNYITMNSLLTIPKAAQDPNGYNPVSKALYGNNAVTTYIIEPQANYTKRIGKGNLQALIGGTWQYSNTNGYYVAGENYSSDGLLQNIGSAGTISFPGPQTSYTEYKYVSAFGRVNYNWMDKYIVNVSFRRDGSSRFGPQKEFGNFGAGGIAWLFSNEDLVKKAAPILSLGKVKLSYGVVGNDQISDYQYLATYGTTINYQGISSLYPTRIANPDYSWEVNRKLEAGVELGLWKDRIFLSVSWFRNRSNNQLVGYPLPTQTGFTSYQANLPALVQNRGWEFLLNTVNVKSSQFSWTSSFNLSFIDNKLLDFPGLASSSYANTYVVGKSINIVKAYHYVRIDPQTGIPQFSTAKGVDTLDPSYTTDRVAIGKRIPDFYGGLNNSFTWKGFQLDFLFQFVKQQGNTPDYWPGLSRFEPTEALHRWQKPGDITDVPKGFTYNVNNDAATAYSPFISSDRFWSDASYIRLKNVAVYYSLPKTWLARMNMSQCRIYLQGQNLLTITKYKGSDPELPGQFYTVPTLRVMTVGIQTTF